MRIVLFMMIVSVFGCSGGGSDPIPPSEPAPLPDMSALKSQESGEGAPVQTREAVKP